MKDQIKINVTDRDIDSYISEHRKLIKTNPFCAIERAIHRHKGLKEFECHYDCAFGTIDNKYIRFVFPTEIKAKIIVIDRGIKIPAFSFIATKEIFEND